MVWGNHNLGESPPFLILPIAFHVGCESGRVIKLSDLGLGSPWPVTEHARPAHAQGEVCTPSMGSCSSSIALTITFTLS